MATQADKIQLLEDELQNLDSKLTYYGDLFNADGRIDKDEKKKIILVRQK